MERNISLKIFLKNTYLSTSLGFGGSVMSGLIFSRLIEDSSQVGIAPALVGLVGALGSIWLFNGQKAKFETIDAVFESKKENIYEKSIIKITVPQYPPMMIASFIGLCLSNGLIMSPALAITPSVAIAKALLMGGIVTAGSSYFALRMKPDAMQPYQPVLYGSLFGLIGLGLLSIGSHLIFGPNFFTQTVSSIDLYGGLALFTALNALDTQTAIKEFKETGKPDFLRVSMTLVMNAINIFVRLLRIQRENNN
ncbi:hypothetical protein DICPUDRAFT_92831 [Dictyostelium purpureum]|uniref:Transmembrane protein n=1 Tax=Dictyostelium purpureum TaxID=5786 RepID=F0ZXX3_DICPU|nr:uncharacterized protein DICPUDRAFT_92831 [Dictyostelium purpureum]EGC31201.1 hypothetical protein DICPUDRAFT_92831 [Dictyostelium purpureum]|eukprot:XP_003292261.1 hypothetical protein DICPUDRAFT_92831 [Dictyostelium purpureum]